MNRWQSRALLEHGVAALRLRPMRSALGAVAVAVFVASYSVVTALADGARDRAVAAIGDLGSRRIIVRADAPKERASPARWQARQAAQLFEPLGRDVVAVGWIKRRGNVRAGTERSSAAAAAVVLASSGYWRAAGLEIAQGRALSASDEVTLSQACVIGEPLAIASRANIDDWLSIGSGNCRVVGILSRFAPATGEARASTGVDFDNAVILPMPAHGRGMESDIDEAIVTISDAGGMPLAAQLVSNQLGALDPGLRQALTLLTPLQLVERMLNKEREFRRFAWILCAVSLLGSALTLASVMLASTHERVREIGVRRAYGATGWHIAAQFVFEAGILCVAGAVAGLLMGIGTIWLGAMALGWETSLSLGSLAGTLAMALAVGAVAALFPTYEAVRVLPIDALRAD